MSGAKSNAQAPAFRAQGHSVVWRLAGRSLKDLVQRWKSCR
jgi:hypothetical protein